MNVSILNSTVEVNGTDFLAFGAKPELKPEKFQRYEPKEKAFRQAHRRSGDGVKIGLKLRGAAIAGSEIDSTIDGDLIVSLSQKSSGNHSVFHNHSDFKDRAFTAATAFIGSGSRVDGVSARKASYKPRKQLRKAFLERELDIVAGKVFPFFITPTFPNLPNTDFVTNFLFLVNVWTKFRKTDYFKRVIDGAYRKFEFTTTDAEILNYNFHPHLLGLTTVEFADNSEDCPKQCKKSHRCINNFKNPQNVEFAAVWTHCLQLSSKEMFDCEIDLGKLEHTVVDFRRVSLNDVRTVERHGVLFELTKYMAKSSDFLDLQPSELLAANKILKGKRLLAAVGSFNDYKGKAAAVFNKQRLYDAYQLQEYMTWKARHNSQDFLFAKSGTLDGFIKGNIMTDLQNRIAKRNELNRLERKQKPKFDKGYLSMRELRKVGRELNSSGVAADRVKWLALLDRNVRLMVADARNKFLERHPNAEITTLDGKIYLGEGLKARMLESVSVATKGVVRH